jgi:beta-glucosidase
VQQEQRGVLGADLGQVGHGRQAGGVLEQPDQVAGGEVQFVYASLPDGAVERPARWLAGFAKVNADPGAEARADIPIPLRCLAYWDTATRRWTVEPGEYRLSIGRSSRDLPMAVTVFVELTGQDLEDLHAGEDGQIARS